MKLSYGRTSDSFEKYRQINRLHTVATIDFQIPVDSTRRNGDDKQNGGETILNAYITRVINQNPILFS